MAQNVMQRIERLNEVGENLIARERTHHDSQEDHRSLETIDHDLKVLWDLRRRELAGEEVSLDEDYFDRYDRYN
ncbi:MAG: hypothetical protein ACR2GU_16105 [Rubrobacteraceae bacterium]